MSHIIHIEQTTSTNDLAKEAQYHHGDIIWAEVQLNGRGQRGNKWSSGRGESLTFSMVLEPNDFAIADHFRLLQASSLAIAQVLDQYGVSTQIKWTNDIYVGDKKLAGILIENSFHDSKISRSIIGVGININQTEFDPSLPNPTSLRMLTNQTNDRAEILGQIKAQILHNLTLDREQITTLYRSKIYRLNQPHQYKLASGEVVEATIQDVRSSGELVVKLSNSELREFLFKEIEFII